KPDLARHQVEKIAALAVLDLDQPKIGVELEFAHDPRFDVGLADEAAFQTRDKKTIGGARLVKGRLRSRPEQGGTAVEPRDFDKDRARLFGPASAYHGESALDVTTADVSRD